MSAQASATAERLLAAHASSNYDDREVALEAARQLWDDVSGGLSLQPWSERLVQLLRHSGDVRVLKAVGQALALDLLQRQEPGGLARLVARRLFRPHLLSAAPRLAAAGRNPWPLLALGIETGVERVVDLLSLCLREDPELLAPLAQALAAHPDGQRLVPAFLVEAALWRGLGVDAVLHLVVPSLAHEDPKLRRKAARVARLAAEAEGDLRGVRDALRTGLSDPDERTSETCATALALHDGETLSRLVRASSLPVRRGALMACSILARSESPVASAIAHLEQARWGAGCTPSASTSCCRVCPSERRRPRSCFGG